MGFLDWFFHRNKGKPAPDTAIASSPSKRWRYGPDGKTKIWAD